MCLCVDTGAKDSRLTGHPPRSHAATRTFDERVKRRDCRVRLIGFIRSVSKRERLRVVRDNVLLGRRREGDVIDTTDLKENRCSRTIGIGKEAMS